MPRFVPCFLVLCAALLGDGDALAQNAQPRPTFSERTVSVSTSTGQKQDYTVTDEDKVKMRQDMIKLLREGKFVNATPDSNVRQTAPEAVTAAAPQQKNDLRAADGRALPFTLSGTSGGSSPSKKVDENVDPHSALRRFSTREQNLSERRYEKENWNTKETSSDRYSKTINYEQWTSKFSAWGGRETAPIDMKNSFDAEQRDMPVLERKKYDGKTSPWSRDFAEFKNQNQRHPQDLHSRYLAQDSMSFKERMLLQEKSLESVSMQDINRIAFRRNHPTAGGLPVTAPGKPMKNDHFSAN